MIDKRNVGGRLWGVGGPELDSTVKEFEKEGILFSFTENGSRKTKHLPG
ncbi:hypothetical protein [Metabacillus litoralis]|nr:hypothetical protein [Metabacillus litoralis]MCM3654290.1 hypothetical protein [Metabacillus litoralis]